MAVDLAGISSVDHEQIVRDFDDSLVEMIGYDDSLLFLLLRYKFNDFTKDLISKAESDKSVSFNQSAFDKFGSATRDFSNLSIPSNYNYY